MDECSFPSCKEEHLDAYRVSVDYFGRHWFCSKHWDFVCFLFNRIISPCARSKKGCIRNHIADYYEERRIHSTVKYNGKHFDLCDEHLRMYNELLGMNIILDYD